jgi:hypothetical protein
MVRNRVLTPKSRGCYHPTSCPELPRRCVRIWLGGDAEEELDQTGVGFVRQKILPVACLQLSARVHYSFMEVRLRQSAVGISR